MNHWHNTNKRNRFPFCKCGCGRKVDKAQRLYLPGHRPKKKLSLCACGCGELCLTISAKYIPGHYAIIKRNERLAKETPKQKRRPFKIRPLCQCGCGKRVNKLGGKYLPGHYNMLLYNERQHKIESLPEAPLCACGCGLKVTNINLNKGIYSWNKFINNHNSKTKKFRTMQRLRAAEFHCPNVGQNEPEVFSLLQSICPYKILCLDNQQKIAGYHLDGYIKELNLVIEYDESFHTAQKEKDLFRENNIKEKLNCEFFRISEDEWINKKELIISNFKQYFLNKL